MGTISHIAMGSNLGERGALLRSAVRDLAGHPGVSVRRTSRVYETDPEGPVRHQPRFLNGVVEVETTLGARDLLELLLDVEAAHGRVRAERGGPRTLDLDLLYHGREVHRTPGLWVPHPRIEERAFVLVPLCDIAPDLVNPVTGRSASEALAALVASPVGHPGRWPALVEGIDLFPS